MTDFTVPVAAPPDVDPIFYRAQMLQTMAMTYKRAVKDLSDEDATASALATWETEWDDDPAPRTMDAAIQAVVADLDYWGDD
jgi:hypothetical protein